MKKLLLFTAILIILSACNREPIRFSVLGDSYSAFEGTVYPDSNAVFSYDKIGLEGPDQMWWHQVADSTGWLLEKNNSFSGSLISNANASNYYGPYSFIRRMDNLGNPDVIFILGGANDVRFEVPFGDYVYSDWTEEQLCTFRPALAYLFYNLKQLYPKAKLYFLLETYPWRNRTDAETRLNLAESVHRIAYHYKVNCIDLYDLHTRSMHPDVFGQKSIADQVMDYILNEKR